MTTTIKAEFLRKQAMNDGTKQGGKERIGRRKTEDEKDLDDDDDDFIPGADEDLVEDVEL